MKVIVVGATGTIGSEVVKALRANKHEVVAASRKGDTAVDIEDAGSIEKLFATVKDVDAVVSCAGDGAFKHFTELTDADYQLSVRSKLMGQVNLARTASKHLRPKGSVTLTTGIVAMHPMAGSSALSLVNAGVEGFVRAAALEIPNGLRINVVSPPWIKETMVKHGMDPAPGLSSADCAKAYVAAVEGSHQGKVIDAAKLG